MLKEVSVDCAFTQLSLNSKILIAANKDLDLRSVQDLRYSGHCFDLVFSF